MPVMHAADAPTIEAHGILARPLVVPSRGSTELAIWRLTLPPRYVGAAHSVDREEVFLLDSGELAGAVADQPVRLAPGDALTVPPDTLFHIGNPGDSPAELLVCTSAGVRATLDGQLVDPPWAR